MNNNYYIPDISDLYIGYECEKLNYSEYDKEFWTNHIVGQGHDFTAGFRERKPFYFPDIEFLRTPFLTKEQIEAEKWNLRLPSPNNMLFLFEKIVKGRCWLLNYYKNEKWLAPIEIFYEVPEKEDERGSRTYYTDKIEFKCPSINEFRTITKLIGI